MCNNSTALRTLSLERVLDAAKAGEGKHGNSRHHVKAPGLLSGTQGDFHQVFRGGIDINAGVGKEVQISLAVTMG